MSNSNDSTVPLVGISGADNTFLVPDVIRREVVSDDKYLSNHKLPNELFDRDVLIYTGTVQTLDDFKLNILGNFDPFDWYLKNPAVIAGLKPYGFINFGLIVTIRMVAPGSCYGLYNMQAICDGGVNYGMDSSAFDAYPSSTQDVHGFLNIELRNNVIFELPWEHHLNGIPLPYLPPTSTVGCWRLAMWPFAPIRSTLQTSTSASFQIFARMMPERHLVNLAFQGKKEHPVSSKLKEASNLSSMVSSFIPSIAPFTLPISAGLAAAASLADAMGFTREAKPETPQSFIARQTSALAPVDNFDTGEIVALSVTNTLSIDPSPGGGQASDPMAYADLFQRWTVVDRFTITETSISTSVLRNHAVSPYSSNYLPGFYPKNPIAIYPPVAGWVGMPFSSWRGGMEYMIYIPSSSNLQGSLQILWDPAPLPPQPGQYYSSDPTNVLANVVIDLKGSSKTVLQVGYSKLEPVAESIIIQAGTEHTSANGHLVFRLISKLVSPIDVPLAINVIVMSRAMPDMQFGIPTTAVKYRASDTTTSLYPLDTLRYQAESGDDEVENVIVLVPTVPYPTKDVHYGEEFASVRALIQHFCPAFNVVVPTLGSSAAFFFAHYFPINSSWREQQLPNLTFATGTTGPPPFTYFAYYMAAFVGVRGGMRWKLISDSGNISNVTACAFDGISNVDYPYLSNFTGSGKRGLNLAISDLQVATQTNGCEFTIPSRLRVKYESTRIPFNVANTVGRRIDCLNVSGTVEATVFVAAAPDITVTRFRRVPAILVQPDVP